MLIRDQILIWIEYKKYFTDSYQAKGLDSVISNSYRFICNWQLTLNHIAKQFITKMIVETGNMLHLSVTFFCQITETLYQFLQLHIVINDS